MKVDSVETLNIDPLFSEVISIARLQLLDCGTFVAASSSFADSRKKRGSTSLSGIADISRLLMSVIVHEMIAIMGPRQRDPASRQKRITLTLDLATRLS
jgi:hypothetical protein